MTPASNCCSASPSATNAALGIGSHGQPFDQWGRFLPEHTTAVSVLDQLLHHSIAVVTEGESFRMRQVRSRGTGQITKK